MSFEEPEDLRVIDHADSFIICTEDNPIQILINTTVKSFMILKAVSLKNVIISQQTILTFAVSFLDSWETIDIGLSITITHHKYTFLIHSTPMNLMCTQQTTYRNMLRHLVIFAYTPDVKCSNEYHTSQSNISFPQHTHEVFIYTLGKTFVTLLSLIHI